MFPVVFLIAKRLYRYLLITINEKYDDSRGCSMNVMTNLATRTKELFEVDERLLFENSQWYVRTREVPQLGPFGSRDEAIAGLYQHVELWNCKEVPSIIPLMPASTVHRLEDCDVPHCGLCAELALLRDCATPRPSAR